MDDEDLKFAFEADVDLVSVIEFNHNNKKSYLFISRNDNQYNDTDILPFNIMGTVSATTSINGLYANMIKQTMPNCFHNFSRIICAQSIK